MERFRHTLIGDETRRLVRLKQFESMQITNFTYFSNYDI